MVWLEFRKILKSPTFWLCSLVFFLCLITGSWEDLASGDHGLMATGVYEIGALYELFNSFFYSGCGSVILPLLSVLPSAFLYLEEKGSYQRCCLIRMDKKRYLQGKILASLLSAITLVALALLVYTIFLLWYFPAGWGPPLYSDFTGTIYENLWQQGKTGWMYLFEVLRIFCGAIEWPVLALALSTLTDNKYVVIATPFLLELLLNYVGEVTVFFWIMPKWHKDLRTYIAYEWLGGWPLTFLYLLLLIGIPALVFTIRLRRSFVHG